MKNTKQCKGCEMAIGEKKTSDIIEFCSENRLANRATLGVLVCDYRESRFELFMLMGEPAGHGCFQ